MSVGNKQHWCYVATEEMHCGGATETAWYWSKWPGPLIYCKITVRSAVVYPDSPLFVLLHTWSFCCVLCLRLSMMEYLSNSSLISVLDYVRQHFIDFLQLPRHKQMALAEKAIDVLVSTKSLWIFNISWLRLMQCNIYIYIYIYAFSRRFYPKRLTLHSSYSFYILSALAFPGNRTHDLGVASAMLYQLSYRKAPIKLQHLIKLSQWPRRTMPSSSSSFHKSFVVIFLKKNNPNWNFTLLSQYAETHFQKRGDYVDVVWYLI